MISTAIIKKTNLSMIFQAPTTTKIYHLFYQYSTTKKKNEIMFNSRDYRKNIRSKDLFKILHRLLDLLEFKNQNYRKI